MPALLRHLALAAPALAALPAWAALPPNYQRLAELKAVLAHPGLTEALGGDAPIDRIDHVSRDLYRVRAGRCHVDVAIADLPTPSDVAGPRRFEARVGQRVCARESEAR